MPRTPKMPDAPSPQELVPSEDRAGKEPAFSSEGYNKAARSAKLQGINLIRCSFASTPEFFRVRREGSELDLRYGCTTDTAAFLKDEGIGSLEWKWSVTVFDGKKKTLSVQATYLVIYDNFVECEEDSVKRFMSRVGRFASYPYFRSHVSQISWESGTSLPILPVIST